MSKPKPRDSRPDIETKTEGASAEGGMSPSEADPARVFANETDFRRLCHRDSNLGLTPASAVLLLAYLDARARKFPGTKVAAYPDDVVAYARALPQSKPMVWLAVLRADYMGMSRALYISGMPVLSAGELQTACTRLGKSGGGASPEAQKSA